MNLDRFSRVALCHRPTALEPLDRLSQHLGGPRLFVKRDDTFRQRIGVAHENLDRVVVTLRIHILLVDGRAEQRHFFVQLIVQIVIILLQIVFDLFSFLQLGLQRIERFLHLLGGHLARFCRREIFPTSACNI